MGHTADFIVIGGGIAGASVAAELAQHASVLLLEQEAQPGYHASGRSAALFSETYGNAVVRALSTASRAFLAAPPEGFSDAPLLTPRGVLHVGGPDRLDRLDALCTAVQALVPATRRLTAQEVLSRVPALRPEAAAGGVLEPDAMDIETNALLQGCLRLMRRRGGRSVTDAAVTGLRREAGVWRVATAVGGFEAPVVVNAAGAWADEVARLAGVEPIGLTPLRRTAILFDPPGGTDARHWPLVIDVDETFYFKPDAGLMLASPADETPSPPTDAQPDEYDVAVTVDRIETATTLRIGRIPHRWAGLRSFVADRSPVAGFDPAAPGFFWLAGQGGYGFQTAPALARTAAALALGGDIPADVAAIGLSAARLSPGRLR